MTRAFTPPDTMSKDDIRTVADVRREIWTDAFYGMAVGSLSALALHGLTNVAAKRGVVKGLSLNRNTALFSFLAGGAFGSFLMATTTGKNQVHKLHPIFQVGSKEEYEESLIRAQHRESELRSMEQDRLQRRGSSDQQSKSVAGFVNDPEEERKMRQRNRLLRRRTLQDSMERQHGLSDSHGGRWAAEDELPDAEAERRLRQQNRMLRRQTLQDNLQRQHGLSDSHGGQWVSDDDDHSTDPR